jgi:hypothetical protein
MVTENFLTMIRDASARPALRGRLLYFPGEVCATYGVEGAELQAVVHADMNGLEFKGPEAALARAVFDTHDMFAGE